jgi:hypothetical protein
VPYRRRLTDNSEANKANPDVSEAKAGHDELSPGRGLQVQ